MRQSRLLTGPLLVALAVAFAPSRDQAQAQTHTQMASTAADEKAEINALEKRYMGSPTGTIFRRAISPTRPGRARTWPYASATCTEKSTESGSSFRNTFRFR